MLADKENDYVFFLFNFQEAFWDDRDHRFALMMVKN